MVPQLPIHPHSRCLWRMHLGSSRFEYPHSTSYPLPINPTPIDQPVVPSARFLDWGRTHATLGAVSRVPSDLAAMSPLELHREVNHQQPYSQSHNQRSKAGTFWMRNLWFSRIWTPSDLWKCTEHWPTFIRVGCETTLVYQEWDKNWSLSRTTDATIWYLDPSLTSSQSSFKIHVTSRVHNSNSRAYRTPVWQTPTRQQRKAWSLWLYSCPTIYVVPPGWTQMDTISHRRAMRYGPQFFLQQAWCSVTGFQDPETPW